MVKKTDQATIPATAIEVQNLDGFSPQAMDHVVDSACIEHFQLGRGKFNGEALRVRSHGDVLDSGMYSQPILARGQMSKKRITLGLVLPVQPGGLLNGFKLDAPVPFLFSEGEELACRFESGTRWFSFQPTREEVEVLGLSLPDSHGGALACDATKRADLIIELESAFRDLRTLGRTDRNPERHEGFVRERIEGVTAAICRALSPELDRVRAGSTQRHRRLVCAVREHIDGNLAGTVRIRELCKMSGVSYKTLERAFVSVLGVTPRRYLSFKRLSHARRLLLDRDREMTKIREVAVACGYDHFARFSQDYRELFGETPSQTLSKTA